MGTVRRAVTLLLGLTLTTVLAACGGSSSGGTTPSNISGPTVTIKNFAFNPPTLNVKVGQTVTFVQEDTIPHTATGSGSSSFIASPALQKGQTYTVKFTKAGTYNYICSIHPNMHGTVVVS
jgi:amicyanin